MLSDAASAVRPLQRLGTEPGAANTTHRFRATLLSPWHGRSRLTECCSPSLPPNAHMALMFLLPV